MAASFFAESAEEGAAAEPDRRTARRGQMRETKERFALAFLHSRTRRRSERRERRRHPRRGRAAAERASWQLDCAVHGLWTARPVCGSDEGGAAPGGAGHIRYRPLR